MEEENHVLVAKTLSRWDAHGVNGQLSEARRYVEIVTGKRKLMPYFNRCNIIMSCFFLPRRMGKILHNVRRRD